MDKEYIERKEILKQIRLAANRAPLGMITEPYLDWRDVISFIVDAPVEDVAPRETAHWELVEVEAFRISNMKESLKTGKPTKEVIPRCSHCKEEFGTMAFEFNYCPNCGAKITKEIK